MVYISFYSSLAIPTLLLPKWTPQPTTCHLHMKSAGKSCLYCIFIYFSYRGAPMWKYRPRFTDLHVCIYLDFHWKSEASLSHDQTNTKLYLSDQYSLIKIWLTSANVDADMLCMANIIVFFWLGVVLYIYKLFFFSSRFPTIYFSPAGRKMNPKRYEVSCDLLVSPASSGHAWTLLIVLSCSWMAVDGGGNRGQCASTEIMPLSSFSYLLWHRHDDNLAIWYRLLDVWCDGEEKKAFDSVFSL